MPEERTFGFSKPDALELIQLIGGADSEFPEMRVRRSGIRLVRFQLKEGFATGTASATLKTMDGEVIEVADVLDPEGIFEELVARDTGLALKQSGKYYAIQAPCGGIETSSSSSSE